MRDEIPNAKLVILPGAGHLPNPSRPTPLTKPSGISCKALRKRASKRVTSSLAMHTRPIILGKRPAPGAVSAR